MQATVSFVKMNDEGPREKGERTTWGSFHFDTLEEFNERRAHFIYESRRAAGRQFAGSAQLYRGPEGDLWLAEVTIATT